jgi:hypothetical protein
VMVYPYPGAYLSEENQYQGGDFVPPGLGLAVCETAAVYIPRNPEESILYGVVAAPLETFLERQHRRDRIVPRFVERELRSFLECGILANGFLRVYCDDCRKDRIVPVSVCMPMSASPPMTGCGWNGSAVTRAVHRWRPSGYRSYPTAGCYIASSAAGEMAQATSFSSPSS